MCELAKDGDYQAVHRRDGLLVIEGTTVADLRARLLWWTDQYRAHDRETAEGLEAVRLLVGSVGRAWLLRQALQRLSVAGREKDDGRCKA